MVHSFISRVLTLALGLAGIGTAVAAPVITNTLTDCTPLALSVALKSGGVVQLSCDTTIVMTNTLFITRDVVLDGAGRNVSISGGSSNRIFQVEPGVTLTLRSISLIDGRDEQFGTNAPTGISGRGGAIFNNHGRVILVDSRLTGNTVVGANGQVGAGAGAGDAEDGEDGGVGEGGAIFNNGGLLVATNTVFTGNVALGGNGGNGGTSTAGGNGGRGGNGGAGGIGSGGAIFNTVDGFIQLVDCTFFSNRVAGAIGGNAGAGSGVAGLGASPGNAGSGLGGAVYNAGGDVIILNTTFSANNGAGANGLNGLNAGGDDSGQDGEAGGAGQGGAIYSTGGAINLTNATFYANFVAGGNGGNGGTGGASGFGGTGGDGGTGGAALGGAIYNTVNGRITMINCSLSGNSSNGGNGGLGGVGGGFTGTAGEKGDLGLESGGAVYNAEGDITLRNTIVAASLSGGNCGGGIDDGGNNLSSDHSCQFESAGSANNVNPGIAILASNGGFTPTLALLTNSPAIDAGNDDVSPSFDQRRAARVGRSDIGAFEFGGILPDFMVQLNRQGTHQVTVNWPSSTLGLVLETSETLSPAPVWIPVTNVPTVLNKQNVLTLTSTNRTRFFRLKKP